MKLIIDIPEETYNNIQSRDWKNGKLVFSKEWKAIHNGTPLVGVLQDIRKEILETKHIMTEGKTVKINNHSTVHDIVNGLNMAIGIVERHIKEIEGSDKE